MNEKMDEILEDVGEVKEGVENRRMQKIPREKFKSLPFSFFLYHFMAISFNTIIKECLLVFNGI